MLVVIGVIALLISILMPVLGRAQRQAKKVQCLSNLRQLGQAYTMYLGENKGKPPLYALDGNFGFGEAFWMKILAPYHGNTHDVRVCPETPNKSGGWGSAFLTWGPDNDPSFMGEYYGSYAYNGWLHYTPGEAMEGMHVKPGTKYPETVPMFADAVWMDTWATPWDQLPTQPAQLYTGINTGLGRVCIARHGKAIDIVFLEGHAQTVPLEDLALYQWFNGMKGSRLNLPNMP